MLVLYTLIYFIHGTCVHACNVFITTNACFMPIDIMYKIKLNVIKYIKYSN